MSDYGSASDSDNSDNEFNEFNEIGAGKTVELTDLESGGGQKSKMYANPMMSTADPIDSTTDDLEADEDDRARRFQQATQKQEERARVHDRLRARVSNAKGHPTVEERRAARTAKKNNISLTSNAKSTFSKFWNGHLDSSKGKRDQTHHPHGKNWNEDSFKEQKQEHEAAYSHFLKTPFKPDVTYPNENVPHISSTRARVRQALRTPRLVEAMPDESLNNPPSYDPVTHVVEFYGKKYSPLSFFHTNLGTHKCNCCGVAKGDSDIQGYGLGVVLWFKYIKWMGFMFLGLTLLATPQFLMFGSSGKLMGQLETESALHVLAQLGMANMGEGSTLCATGVTSSSTSTKDSVLALQCAKGQTIDQITSVHYGHGEGLCRCPGTTKFVEQYGAQLPPDPTFPMSCSNPKYPYSGVDEYANERCCSSKKLVDGNTDLSSLLFKNTATCFSPPYSTTGSGGGGVATVDADASSRCGSSTPTRTASKGQSGTNSRAYDIVRLGCRGKNGCVIPINDLTMWNGTDFSLCNPPNWTDFSNASRSVAYNFYRALGTNMEGCNENPNVDKTLNVIAVCTDETITFFDIVVDKNTVWIILTLTEVAQCMFVLFMVFILRTSSKKDGIEMGNEVDTIELYTIFLPRIHELAHDPVYKDIVASKQCEQNLLHDHKKNSCFKKYPTHMVNVNKLKSSLTHHFERLLSSRKPVGNWVESVGSDAMGHPKWPVKVAAVQFGRRDGVVVHLKKQRGHLLHELQHEMAHLEHASSHITDNQLKKLEKHIHTELDTLQDLDDQIQLHEADPNIHNPECAFITFEKKENKLRALATYPRSSIFYWCCQGRDPARCCCPERRVRAYVPPSDGGDTGEDVRSTTCSCTDKDEIYYRPWLATETPAPGNLRWENLAYGKKNRCFRSLCSSCVTVILLLLTIGGSILVKNETLKQARLYPAVDCAALTLMQPSGVITKSDAILDQLKLHRVNR